jgi:O-succinylbenzoate synthase
VIDGLKVLPFQVDLKIAFRGVTSRSGLLIKGPCGWGEFSPFPEYGVEIARRWAQSAWEAATEDGPKHYRTRVPVNVTVPAVDPATARRMVLESGCSTAKIKVGAAKGGTSRAFDDEARIEAVRDALGPTGRIRLDANRSWDVEMARRLIDAWACYDLEYVEQPVPSIEEMAELRRLVDVRIAADESVRDGDPRAIKDAGAADIVVLKVQPLGGITRSIQIAEMIGLPVVVSSALETSIGIAFGLALAAALPELDFACGLATASLLAADVVDEPALPVDGYLEVARTAPSEARLMACRPDANEISRLTQLFDEATAGFKR